MSKISYSQLLVLASAQKNPILVGPYFIITDQNKKITADQDRQQKSHDNP